MNKSNGFKLPSTKTTGIVFHKKREPNNPKIFLYNTMINFENQVTFLAITLNFKFKYEPHIAKLRTKPIKASQIMKILTYLRWDANRLTLLRIYRAIILSKIDYGCQSYGTAIEEVLYKLSVIHQG